LEYEKRALTNTSQRVGPEFYFGENGLSYLLILVNADDDVTVFTMVIHIGIVTSVLLVTALS